MTSMTLQEMTDAFVAFAVENLRSLRSVLRRTMS